MNFLLLGGVCLPMIPWSIICLQYMHAQTILLLPKRCCFLLFVEYIFTPAKNELKAKTSRFARFGVWGISQQEALSLRSGR